MDEFYDFSYGTKNAKAPELGVKLSNPHLDDTAKRVVAAKLMVYKRAKKYFIKLTK